MDQELWDIEVKWTKWTVDEFGLKFVRAAIDYRADIEHTSKTQSMNHPDKVQTDI